MPKTKLTAIIVKGDFAFVGYIKEVGGIISQAPTEDQAFADLLECTEGMLQYKLPGLTMEDIEIVRESGGPLLTIPNS